MIRMID